jgi:lipoprotein signal peptidase
VAAVIGLAFGGATGNLLDQRRIGGVRDFVDFGLGAFNLADVAIVAGTACAALLVIAGGGSGCEPRPH